MKQFVGLSGMPRSGSTLLAALLSQNPLIHAEGNSAVCQLMWDMYVSCMNNVNEQLKGNYREHLVRDFITQIPKTYYQYLYKKKEDDKLNTDKIEIIVDKCRAWTRKANTDLLRQFIDPHIKIIVMERSVTDVIKSFYKLLKKNNWTDEMVSACLTELLTPETEPVRWTLEWIKMAREAQAQAQAQAEAEAEAQAQNDPTFLFIHYNELIENTAEVLDRIYAFCGWQPFQHTFTEVVNRYPENDEFYGLDGFHTIRSVIGKEENTMVLPPDIMKMCTELDNYYT
jgi:sulfotransferase